MPCLWSELPPIDLDWGSEWENKAFLAAGVAANGCVRWEGCPGDEVRADKVVSLIGAENDALVPFHTRWGEGEVSILEPLFDLI